MGNNNLKDTNKILVKVDQNNLIYIDPNSVTSDGRVESRGVEPENLVMYVNLEADLIPRTTLIAAGNQESLTSIAGGTLNFMQNKDGRDYDTKWTEAYTNVPGDSFNFKNTGVFNAPTNTTGEGGGANDNTAQSFGIDSISIKVAGANFIPHVQIRFIDVRGKTLFESPEDSPYGAFFHLPWPIFYLTIKGFYGKAIKYRLHMVKFNSRFNPTNGNMEVDTTFVGSTYAYLADISLESIMNAPYFYLSESDLEENLNEKTGKREIFVSKTTKGYRVLRSVYQEYIEKGLLPEEFPVRTLRELIIIAGRLSKTLEQEIFNKVIDPKILAAVKEFESQMSTFEGGVSAWKTKNISPEYFTNGQKRTSTGEEIRWYKLAGQDKNTLNKIVNPKIEGTLERLIFTAIEQFEGNMAFGKNRNPKLIKNQKLSISPIDFTMLKNTKDFYIQDVTVGVDMDGVEDAIYTVYRNFIEQRNTLESELEEYMNEIIKKKDVGIGFEPTIRNIIGVVLANADTYIRLMKDVHVKAFQNAEVRRKILSSVETDSDKKDQSIYPWPEVKVQSAGNRQRVLVYPGSREMLGRLQSNDQNLWPEVEFVENFYEVATKKLDPLTGKEGASDNIEFIFKTQESTDKIDIGVLTNMLGTIPYTNKSFSSIIYEIYERAKYTTSTNPFSNDVMIELANAEFENIKNHLYEDIDILDMLRLNITSPNTLLTYMASLSAFERFPYYQDQLPTVWYLKDALDTDFRVSKYRKNSENTSTENERFTKLSNFLLNYKAEDYRLDIYPFNSDTYSEYLGHDFGRDDLDMGKMLEVDTPFNFISSPIDADMWVKDGLATNLFENTVEIGGVEKHMLNTPYFHKQLYDEFVNPTPREKYVGSAYLLLNSLPFKDLDDTISYSSPDKEYGPTLMSTVFREIGASHHIPYHMMLKWGSIYHRYKKYIQEHTDILNLSGLTYLPISALTFFDNNSGFTYNNTSESIGFHPFYETIFHQIANGYGFFNPDSPATYDTALDNNYVYLYTGQTEVNKTYSSFVDKTKFGYSGYTLLPTNGYNNTYGEDKEHSTQENFRILWSIGTDDKSTVLDYSGYTFPSYTAYTRDVSTGDYSLSENYRKVIDLMATFKPDILEIFEQAFLDFASEKLNQESTYLPFEVQYPYFQDLLQAISTVSKENSDESQDTQGLMKAVKNRQETNLKTLTNQLLSPDNLVKIEMPNPREVDNYVLGGFTGVNVQNFNPDSYGGTNSDGIKLYLGEDLDRFYEEFFERVDVNPSEDNIKQFRSIAYIYAGLRANGINPTKVEFVEYLKDNLISPNYTDPDTGVALTKDNVTGVSGMDTRLNVYLTQLTGQFIDLVSDTTVDRATKQRGYNDDPIKLELYNYFKSFNDKWTAGNSIGQRLLLEEFLFLDKANKDIGDKLFIDMQKLVQVGDPSNSDINLFSLLVLLTKDSGIDIRALPAYVNFYETNQTSGFKPRPSKNIAETMFGTFLNVDHEDSAPKVILQYTGPTSKHPEMADIDKKYKYKNDGFNIGDVNNNPIIVAPDVFTQTDFSKSNKVVAFEVSFGDQNQSIFKEVELDQATLRNTSESFEVLERLGRNETGSSTSQIDIGLFNIYRQSSYECTVTAMGNMMIQPTMYFYVKNIPLFKGSYLITEVTHDVKTTGAQTRFKGTRIPADSLPDPEDSFLASYRPLFDKLVKKARALVDEERRERETNTATSQVLVDADGSYRIDPGNVALFQGETILKRSGITQYGIPYNGAADEKDILLINYDRTPGGGDTEWLRAIAVTMGGQNYPIDPNQDMSIISNVTYTTSGYVSKIKWRDIKDTGVRDTSADVDGLGARFYSCNFIMNGTTPMIYTTADAIRSENRKTEFLNPRLVEANAKNKGIVTVPNIGNYIFGNIVFEGPVNVGPAIDGYGIGLSPYLMQLLALRDGQVVYFRMI